MILLRKKMLSFRLTRLHFNKPSDKKHIENVIEGIERTHNVSLNHGLTSNTLRTAQMHTHHHLHLLHHLPPWEPGPNIFSVRIKHFTDSVSRFLIEATCSFTGKLYSWQYDVCIATSMSAVLQMFCIIRVPSPRAAWSWSTQ